MIGESFPRFSILFVYESWISQNDFVANFHGERRPGWIYLISSFRLLLQVEISCCSMYTKQPKSNSTLQYVQRRQASYCFNYDGISAHTTNECPYLHIGVVSVYLFASLPISVWLSVCLYIRQLACQSVCFVPCYTRGVRNPWKKCSIVGQSYRWRGGKLQNKFATNFFFIFPEIWVSFFWTIFLRMKSNSSSRLFFV